MVCVATFRIDFIFNDFEKVNHRPPPQIENLPFYIYIVDDPALKVAGLLLL